MTADPTPGTNAFCDQCGSDIEYLGSPTGSWWAHWTHPADGHDASPAKSNEYMTAACDPVYGIDDHDGCVSGNCTCSCHVEGCSCTMTDRKYWTTSGSTTEPGSMWEPDPDCPVHFPERRSNT